MLAVGLTCDLSKKLLYMSLIQDFLPSGTKCIFIENTIAQINYQAGYQL